MVRVSAMTSTEKRATLPGNIRFGNRNHETEKIVFRKLHDRNGLRTRICAGLHQRSKIRVALGDHAGERRRDSGIVVKALIVSEFCFGHAELALCGFKRGLAGVDLRRGSEIFSLRVIYLLLSHDAGLVLENLVEARVLQ